VKGEIIKTLQAATSVGFLLFQPLAVYCRKKYRRIGDSHRLNCQAVEDFSFPQPLFSFLQSEKSEDSH
jgi:hypothetical protein